LELLQLRLLAICGEHGTLRADGGLLALAENVEPSRCTTKGTGTRKDHDERGREMQSMKKKLLSKIKEIEDIQDDGWEAWIGLKEWLSSQRDISRKSIKLSIEALKKQAQPLAVDANLYEIGKCDNPTAENAYKARREIYTAIAELQKEINE
jgi:hypothetical protein